MGIFLINSLETAKLCFKIAFTSPLAVYGSSSGSVHLPTLGLATSLNFIHSIRYVIVSCYVLFWNSQWIIIKDSQISSYNYLRSLWMECLLKFSLHLFVGLFVFTVMCFESFLYNLDINPLSNIWFEIIFSLSAAYLFILLKEYFKECKLIHLVNCNIFIFVF